MKNPAFHSVRSKKLLAFIALFLAVKFSAAGVVDLGTNIHASPYDQYMTPVREVFDNMGGESTSLDRVNTLMRQGRSFRYTHSEPYRPASPETTASRRAGDCKDKALWLMNQLQDQKVRYVVGRLDRNARRSHAWLLWEHDGQWWILDCTMLSRAIPADRVGANEYVPRYSFSKNSVYRHEERRTHLARQRTRGGLWGVGEGSEAGMAARETRQ